MPYINKIEVMGNLAKDPELRYMPDGTPMTKITVAVAEKWTEKKRRSLKSMSNGSLSCYTVGTLRSCASI
ncbi:single-stranded DNA-binding protein [Neisseria weaveri]|uniref:Single-stranded DNA binding protein n=1 Tax=Neisseria weaveri TaxID=28091 RepID=A0A448VKV9_9NEIS|nr:single-stranded DNA binding protein [Neisseria weaveri]VEJ50420.1 single-stranded DNA binding protein [Neisseria weaveri]